MGTDQQPDKPPDGERPKHRSPTEVVSDRTANGIIIVVTVIWAANIVVGMLRINGYRPDQAINGIFLTVVGGALVLRARLKGGE